MAAPTFQAAGTKAEGTGAISPGWPAHAVGDIGILQLECAATETISLATAAGFVACPSSPVAGGGAAGAGSTHAVYWCRATSTSMAAPTTNDPGNHIAGHIFTIRGAVASGDPFDASDGNENGAASTTTTWPTVTTTGADRLVLLLATRGNDSDAASWSGFTNAALSSLTEHVDDGTLEGNGGGWVVASGIKTTAGATGTTTATVVSSRNSVITLAVLPNAAADFVGAATLSGSGTLTASAAPATATAVTLSGSGTLTATGKPGGITAATLSGSGTLAAAGRPGLTRAATLSGSGTLTASGVAVVIAALSGSGTLTTTRTVTLIRAAALSGAGTLTALGRPSLSRAVILSGSGTLTAAGIKSAVALASLSGAGALAVLNGLANLFGIATLTGAGTLTTTDDSGLVHVLHTLINAAGAPRYNVLVTARILQPAEYLDDGAEVVAGIEVRSGTDGTVVLPLVPSSEYEDTPAVYEVRWQGHRKLITVPDLGPVNLEDVEV